VCDERPHDLNRIPHVVFSHPASEFLDEPSTAGLEETFTSIAVTTSRKKS
jgi:hypothetical protein